MSDSKLSIFEASDTSPETASFQHPVLRDELHEGLVTLEAWCLLSLENKIDAVFNVGKKK